MSFTAKLLRSYLRTNLRGQTRLTILLARVMQSLQFVPIKVAGYEPFYIDLRTANHNLLRGTPWETAPWEQAEQYVMQRAVKKGETVFDIGANIGLHSVVLSKLVGPEGRLCAFEPNSELLPQLGMTLKGLGNATLYPIALSNRSEVATLFIPGDAQMGSLANWTDGREDVGDIHTINCEVRCIDDLTESGMLPHPDFIKCDVEGAELMVFQGGYRAINRIDAPIIMFEANVYNARGFDLTVDSAKNYLADLKLPGFNFFEVQEGGNLVQIERNDPIHSNILAVPRSKLSRVEGLSDNSVEISGSRS